MAALFGFDGRANVTVIDKGVQFDAGNLPRLTFVRAPKGAGKTEALVGLVKTVESTLMVLHRRTLTREASRRVGLDCYLDVQDLSGDRVGICFDSLMRLPEGRKYEVLVIDEVEQVLAHVLSDTIAGDDRSVLFKRLGDLLRRAKAVVAMDADLSWCSFTALTRMVMGDVVLQQGDLFSGDRQNTVRVVVNTSKPGLGKAVAMFATREQLVYDFMKSLGEGKRAFVAANSKAFAGRLDAMVREKEPALRVLLLTAETSGNPEQRAFLEDPAGQSLNYDVIVTSPAAGTGLDITFPERATVIDVVYGFCEPGITTHWDFDQHICRVRHPGAVKAWVSPARSHYETHREVVRQDLVEGIMRNHLILTQDRSPSGVIDDDPLIEMATLKVSDQRWSKNNLRDNFVALKRHQGYDIIYVERDPAVHGHGRQLIHLGRELSDDQYAQALQRLPPLRWSEHQRIRQSIERGEAVPIEDSWRYERLRLERFYRAAATTDLIRLDDKRLFRSRVNLFETVSADLPTGSVVELDRRDRVVADRARKQELIRHLLTATPLVRDGIWNRDAVIGGDDLDQFVELVEQHRPTLETQLNLQVRRDLRQKPVSQLNAILKLLGLKLKIAMTKKDGQRKQYFYHLDPATLDQIQGIAAARRATTGWDFLRREYDWIGDEYDEAEQYFHDEDEGA